ncbi:MAG TPA: aminotransferase [Burkholderiaceae bacterium]|nr:aminotransferase [Burkholderiaceae bacterium]
MSSSHARDVASLIHPYTNLDLHRARGPVVLAKGDGVYVEDDQGRRYLEGMSGLWSTALGFSEKRLADAAYRQMQQLPYASLFGGRSNEPAIELADRLLALTAQFGFDKVLFANSGSEANDQAAKLVWYYHNAIGKPAKKKLIARTRGYHGVTVMAGSLTGLPQLHADFDLPLPCVLRTDCPSFYHEGRPGETEAQFVDRIVGNLERLIEQEGPDTIGAFFAEPVMGAGGVIVPPPGYFERVQAVLKKHDILLVADEVICGFGRTGSLFGSQTFGMRPDIMTMAKALSSSYLPISATLVSKPIFAAMVDESRKQGAFAHGVTYAGHPVCAAVAVEALKIYEERDLVGHVARVAPQFQRRLRALGGHPLVGEARGVGLVGALEIVADKAGRMPFPAAAAAGVAVQEAAMAQGLIVRAIRDALAICPPLIITPAQIDELFDKLGRALDAAHEGLRKAA